MPAPSLSNKKSAAPVAQDEASLEAMIQLQDSEIANLKASLERLQGDLRTALDGLSTLGQEIATVKTSADLKIPPELYDKIDPSDVFLNALNAAVALGIQRHQSIQSYLRNADSNSNIALDIAMSVLKQYVGRHQSAKLIP